MVYERDLKGIRMTAIMYELIMKSTISILNGCTQRRECLIFVGGLQFYSQISCFVDRTNNFHSIKLGYTILAYTQ